jgi:hypothetical protein
MSRKYGKKAQESVKEAMHKLKHGKLRSGGKSHDKVTNPKQAIAIGLSEARKNPFCRRHRPRGRGPWACSAPAGIGIQGHTTGRSSWATPA